MNFSGEAKPSTDAPPPTSPPPAPAPVALDPLHPWFTHARGTSPSAFAAARPPTKVDPARWSWVYARCDPAAYVGAPVPEWETPRGNYSGKWMVMAVPDAYLDERWARACDAVEAGEIYAAKVVPGGGGSSGSPLICYTTDFRDEADVLRAGLALRRRLGATTKLMYKPDVFTIAGVRCPEALETIGPRGGRKKILMCPYRLRPVEADDASEPGAASLHVVKPSLERALELATERWALQSYSDDEDGVDDGDGAGEGRKVGGGRPRGGDASTSEAADPDPGPRAAAAEAAMRRLAGGAGAGTADAPIAID